MYYKPHTLERRIRVQNRDEFGRLLAPEDSWEFICMCRCDSNSDKSFVGENGTHYSPKYHVVCEGHVNICDGDYIRCMKDGELRGEGSVTNRNRLNYLGYTELWM